MMQVKRQKNSTDTDFLYSMLFKSNKDSKLNNCIISLNGSESVSNTFIWILAVIYPPGQK
jgi:hypothetical protein